MRSYPGGIRHDYKDSAAAAGAFGVRALGHRALDGLRALNPRGLSWFALGLVLPLLGVVLLLVSEPNESMVPSATDRRVEMALLPPGGERVRLDLPPVVDKLRSDRLPGPEERERQALLARGEALTLKVRSGDSLDRLFRRNGLSIADLGAMIALPGVEDHLADIRPNDQFEIIHSGERVLSLIREISESERLWIRHDGEGYITGIIDLETEVRTAGVHGTIETSLFEAGAEAGVADAVIMEMANIFQWDIDFFNDVREGDSFTLVHEEIWRDGVKLRDGRIIAAEYVNRGESHRAARYVDAEGSTGWFTPEGMSVRRPFLRNPIEFTRVSSNFNPNRRHPILNTIRAHRGVDLAAPTGTPVRAAGDGKIVARGANGSFGNRVEIQHGGGITTLYAHLSRFGGYGNGARVSQGDVIGYVGMTGGATGPHLHYEYRLNGVHQNPRTVELPDAEPIDREYLADFETQTAGLWRQLDLYQNTLYASNAD